MNPLATLPRLTCVLLSASALQAKDSATRLVAAARSQVGVTLRYDHRYQRLAYPGGDVPLDRGVCTDVVIRAYRALGFDLQVLVHQDMAAAWAEYPKNWGMKGLDANIDHRRVPNLATFLRRHGETLPAGQDPKAYHPGDIVVWRLLGSGVPHIGIVSDRKTPEGVPLMIHNVGYGAQEEDVLFRNPITGHYRWLPDGRNTGGALDRFGDGMKPGPPLLLGEAGPVLAFPFPFVPALAFVAPSVMFAFAPGPLIMHGDDAARGEAEQGQGRNQDEDSGFHGASSGGWRRRDSSMVLNVSPGVISSPTGALPGSGFRDGMWNPVAGSR